MTPPDPVTALTAAVTRLLSDPPVRAQPLPELPAWQALAARDILVRELAAATGALTGAGPEPRPLAVDSLLREPAHVVHAALRALPRALAHPPAPTDALHAWESSPQLMVRGWLAAARAAVDLEPHLPALHSLPGEQAWAVLRDVAAVAAAVPHLDHDLAARLPEGLAAQRDALTDPATHGILRLAVSELDAQLADLPSGQVHLARRDPASARPVPLRSPADLPDGTRRLAAVLHQIGPRVAVTDLRLVARLLAAGIQTTQQLAQHTDAGSALGGLAERLPAAAAHLRQAYEAPLATLGATDPRVRTLTTEVYAQLQAARAQQNLPAALAWLREATPVAEALHQAVHAAGQDLRLLAPPEENASRRQAQLLWVPVPRAHAAQQPVVVALAAAREALTLRSRTLDSLRASAPQQDRSPGVAAAASSAATAAAELRTALRGRTLASHPAPRLPHPAHRPQHPAPHAGLS